jgi:surfeit locus 1 family protein
VRSLLTPRWLLSHVLVVALVVLMVNLGFWQLRRLDERRAENATVDAALAQPVAPVDRVADPAGGFDQVDGVVWRRVTATGTYAVDEQVIVRSRTYQERPGSWVLTPLVLDDGTAVAVNRGWVPIGEDGPEAPPPAATAPPAGRVTVTGVLQPTQERGRFGPTDPDGGRLATLSRLDLGRYQQQVAEDLYPVALQLESSDPPQAGDLPVPVPLPDTGDEGPHLSYAVQWFVFSTIAAVGYVVILRRQLHDRPTRDDRIPEWVG